MYTLFMLFQPAQRRRDHNIIKILLLAIGSSQTDGMSFADPSFHRTHHGVKLNVRLRKRNRGNPGNDSLVIGWYEAVVCRD